MKQIRVINISSVLLIAFSAFALLMVSLMAFFDPQDVMNLVQVKLPNTDAYSSIRGIYGGVGLTIVISLTYLAIKDRKKGLAFLTMLWGLYAVSRLLTILIEGKLGEFGTRWLFIESTLFFFSIVLLLVQPEGSSKLKVQSPKKERPIMV